jgi:hypothetical protein
MPTMRLSAVGWLGKWPVALQTYAPWAMMTTLKVKAVVKRSCHPCHEKVCKEAAAGRLATISRRCAIDVFTSMTYVLW